MPNVDKPFHLPINISKLVNLYNPLFTCQRSNQGQLAEFLLLPIPADPMAVESHKGEMRLQDGAPQLWVTQPKMFKNRSPIPHTFVKKMIYRL